VTLLKDSSPQPPFRRHALVVRQGICLPVARSFPLSLRPPAEQTVPGAAEVTTRMSHSQKATTLAPTRRRLARRTGLKSLRVQWSVLLKGGYLLVDQRRVKRETVPQAAEQTPKTVARDARRLQLLQAAQAVFVASGYQGANMEDIAQAAYVSKPVLYEYFPSKRELYLALLDISLRALGDALHESLRSTKHNKERVHDAIRAYFGYIARDDSAYRLAFESGLSNDPDVRVRREEFRSGFAGAIARIISEDTHLPLPEAELLGRALMGLAQASARYWVEDTAEQGNAALSLDTASELIYRLAWRGISRFPKET
jgi:AcrR family transcriptional regulator